MTASGTLRSLLAASLYVGLRQKPTFARLTERRRQIARADPGRSAIFSIWSEEAEFRKAMPSSVEFGEKPTGLLTAQHNAKVIVPPRDGVHHGITFWDVSKQNAESAGINTKRQGQ